MMNGLLKSSRTLRHWRIVLCAGQSNMHRGGALTRTRRDGDIEMRVVSGGYPDDKENLSAGYQSALAINGCRCGIARTVGATGDTLILGYSFSGTNLATQWRKSANTIYPDWLAFLGAQLDLITARGDTYEILGLCWWQGEADSGFESTANAYAENLTQLLSDLQADLGLAQLPAALVRLSTEVDSPFASTVRAAVESVASTRPLTAFANCDDLTMVDEFHFDGPGLEEVGVRLATQLLTLQ
jgi:lysophospholipase L1-like esterase